MTTALEGAAWSAACPSRSLECRWRQIGRMNEEEDVDRTWKNNKETIRTSAKESLCLHELKQNKPWFDEECLVFWIKGSRLKCSGYRIQAKAM